MCVSEVALTNKLSADDPSPQLTVMLVTWSELETVKDTVTVFTVKAGFGDAPLTVTVGARGDVTVSEVDADPEEPLLSVAATAIVKDPGDRYECVSDVAVPGRLSTVDPSPQLTLSDEIVPSESPAEKVTVTVWPTSAGLGETPLTVTTGDLSLTIAVVDAADADPLLSVAVSWITKL